MDKSINGFLAGILVFAGAANAAPASAAAEEPIIEFHTTLYDDVAEINAFHFVIGAKENTYIDVDCGFGPVEVEVGPAVFDSGTQSIAGTTVTGSVSSEGNVRIYGDASMIDYLDLEGCYITDISFPGLTEVAILNLNHNLLERLDLSHMAKLEALYISDNPFNESPLVVGPGKPDLAIIDMSLLGGLDESFNFSDYPALVSAQVWSVPTLRRADTSGCPGLLQLSVDATNVESVDVSKNANLLILNVGDTRVTNLDLSHNPYLTELYCGHNGSMNSEYKFTSLDLSANTALQRLNCAGNDLADLDVTMLTRLTSLSCQHNRLTSINIDHCPNLAMVDVSMNYMDFATIPAERATFSEYYYSQNPVETARQHPVGAVLDFSERVLRPESVTEAVLYSVNRERPSDVSVVEDEYYAYADGKLTLLKAYPDSVYVGFRNSALPETVLTTNLFLVKDPADIDKPSPAAAINFSAVSTSLAFKVGMSGATPANPVTFQVDFGNGILTDFTATSNTMPAENNVAGKRAGATTTIYVPEGVQLTALGMDGLRVLSMDLDQASALQDLTVTNGRLPSVSLSWNSNLSHLDLSGNYLASIDLAGANGLFAKNKLYEIDLSDNRLESFGYEVAPFVSLDLSGNRLAELGMTKFSNVKVLDLSGNMLESVDLRDCEALEEADFSDNELTAINLLDYNPLKKLDLSGNRFTFASLPAEGRVADYVYAPQKDIVLPEKAPVISLASYLFDKDGALTDFAWKMAETASLVPAGAIRAADGRFFFENPDLGLVFCEMTHPAFPQFAGDNAMRTTPVLTAPMPTHVFATYTPSADGSVALALAGKANTAIYIDWTGLGDLEQLILADTYRNFSGPAMAGKTARFYSYDEDEGMTLLSLSGVGLSDVDASEMKGLTAFCLYDAGLTVDKIGFPESPALRELTLNNCLIDQTPFLAKYPALVSLSLHGNPLASLDVSSLKKLQGLYASNCGMESITLDNPELWELALVNNGFETIDLGGVPAMEQLWLGGNNLAAIDLEPLEHLRAVTIDANRFDFSTLPLPKPGYIMYNYLNQSLLEIQVVDGKVDLSSQAMVGATPTVFRWFIDSPYLDEENNLVGEELVEGAEYTVENGVTTFLADFDHLICVMTNAVFPDLFLLTDFVDVRTGAIDRVDADAMPVEYYNLQGVRVANPVSGVYIRRQGDKASKVVVR